MCIICMYLCINDPYQHKHVPTRLLPVHCTLLPPAIEMTPLWLPPSTPSVPASVQLHRAARLQLHQASSAPQPCPSLRHLKHLHCSYPHLPPTLLRCPVTDTGQAQNAPDDGYSSQRKLFAPFLSEDPFSCLTSEILKAAPSVASSWFNPTEHFFLNPLTPCFPLKLSFFYVDSVRYRPVLHSIGYRAASKQTTALVVVDVRSELQFLKDFGNSSVEANAIGRRWFMVWVRREGEERRVVANGQDKHSVAFTLCTVLYLCSGLHQ